MPTILLPSAHPPFKQKRYHTVTTKRPPHKIRHTLKLGKLDDVNEYIDLLRGGDIVGRAVIVL